MCPEAPCYSVKVIYYFYTTTATFLNTKPHAVCDAYLLIPRIRVAVSLSGAYGGHNYRQPKRRLCKSIARHVATSSTRLPLASTLCLPLVNPCQLHYQLQLLKRIVAELVRTFLVVNVVRRRACPRGHAHFAHVLPALLASRLPVALVQHPSDVAELVQELLPRPL